MLWQFIHSFIPAISIAPLQVLYYTQRRSRLQHGYCIGVSRRSAQANAGKGLAQGPYVTARAGVEPTTLRLTVIASTNAPSRPTFMQEMRMRYTNFQYRKSFNMWWLCG